MERVIIYLAFIFIAFIPGIMKRTQNARKQQMSGTSPQKPEASVVPHKHKQEGVYESYSKKTHNANPGAMPHRHETRHYTSMSDASNLPKGYILLNGEPVRVADLEDK